MKKNKNVKIDFRTTELIKHEAREIPFSYEEELRCLREELGEMEVLKEKIKSKESMLKELYSELGVKKESCVDVIEYNRNKNLGVVVNGLLDRFKDYPFDVVVFLKDNDLSIQDMARLNNLSIDLIVEEFKKKINKEV